MIKDEKQEKINKVKKAYLDSIKESALPYPTEIRKLNIGDSVEVGFLEDCKVEELIDNGKYVLISCKKKNSTELDYKVVDWLSAFKTEDINDFVISTKKIHSNNYQKQITGLIHSVTNYGLIDSPDYQRDYVWTLEDKEKYIDSIMNEREIGKFIFIHHGYEVTPFLEVLDGKQRLNAIMDFVYSKYTYNNMYYHQFSKRDRDQFDRSVSVVEIPKNQTTKESLLQMFLEVNTAGVPQSEEHLTYVKNLLSETKNKSKFKV